MATNQAIVTLSASSTGALGAEAIPPQQYVNNASPTQMLLQIPASGATVVPLPSGVGAFTVQTDPSNAVGLTINGMSILTAGGMFYATIGLGVSAFTINAAAAFVLPVHIGLW